MSKKKEVYTIDRNKKGQFTPEGEVKKVRSIDEITQVFINQKLTNHVESLYKSVRNLRWAVWALLAFDVVMTYGFVRFSQQIVTYLINVGGL